MKLKEVVLAHKKSYILSISMMIMGGVCSIYSGKYLGFLVQEGLVKKHEASAYKYAGLVLLMIACAIVLNWWAKSKMIEASGKSIELLRSYLFDFIQKIKISFYDQTPLGKIVTRITHDVDSMERFLAGSFAQYCVEGISFVLSIGAMLWLAPKYGFFISLGYIPVFILIYLSHKKIAILFKGEANFRSQANANLAEFIRGFFVIRLFGLEDWAYEKYLNVLEKLKKSRLKMNLFYTWFFPLASMLAYAPTVGHLGVGAFMVSRGELPLYIFIAFFQYCTKLSSSLNIFVHELQQVYNIITCAGRVRDFLNSPLEFEGEASGRSKDFPIEGEITYTNVGMAYSDGKWALRDVNFSIMPGEKIGLVGRTGSGKTTCINLLTRLYEFQQGSILIDGIDIREIDPSYLRESIGVVSQDVVLFKGSILENIILGEKYSDEKIQEAIATTGLGRILEKNGMSLETQLYDQGSNLSAGERQLVSIARIYLRTPKILIMDEATANIDPIYEQIIHKALYQLMQGKTCLIIAHRLETLQGCHRIFRFGGGKLLEIQDAILFSASSKTNEFSRLEIQ